MKKGLKRRDFLKLGALAGLSLGTGTRVFAAPAGTDFGTVRFAVISDPHVDIAGKNGMKMSEISLACVHETVMALNLRNPDFVFVCGDLLLDGEKENAEAVKKELDQLKAPYYVVAGNHDFVPADTKKHRQGFTYLTIEEFAKFFSGHGYDGSGKRYYSHNIKPGLRLIALDANLPDEMTKWGGILPAEQIAWLDKELTDHKDVLNLVFMHHNFIPWSADELQGGPKEWFCIDNSAEVRALLTKHASAAPVVISGHRHIGLTYRELNRVNYFICPSVNSYPMRYTLFDLEKDRISWQTPSVPVDTRWHLEARENLLDAAWWRESQFAERNTSSDAAVLAFYENSGTRIGRRKISG